MIIKITVKEDKTVPVYDRERFTCRSDFPVLETTGTTEETVVNFTKGAALAAVGCWTNVPDVVEFKITKEKPAKRKRGREV